MRERLRYRSWTIGAKTLLSHVLLALFAIVFACVVAYGLSYQYVKDKSVKQLVQQAEYIASYDVQEGDTIVLPDSKTIKRYQDLTGAMLLYVTPDF